ncbi:hypothetical protein EBX31_04955 [bacterium]|nr:hypothetical protein [bacterium]
MCRLLLLIEFPQGELVRGKPANRRKAAFYMVEAGIGIESRNDDHGEAWSEESQRVFLINPP